MFKTSIIRVVEVLNLGNLKQKNNQAANKEISLHLKSK